MQSNRRRLGRDRRLLRGMLVAAGMMAASAHAGIPEPGVVLYGKVKAGDILVTNGALQAAVSYNGKTVTNTVDLSSIEGGFSYVMMIPLESPSPHDAIGSDALALSDAPLTMGIQSAVEGAVATAVHPYRGDRAIGPNQRGLIMRLDVEAGAVDKDGDSLDDRWEIAHFSGGGADPLRYGANDDPDRDGSTNYEEYRAWTNPERTASVLTVHLSCDERSDEWVVSWPGVEGRLYDVLSSTDLREGLHPVAARIPGASSEANEYRTSSDGALRIFGIEISD